MDLEEIERELEGERRGEAKRPKKKRRELDAEVKLIVTIVLVASLLAAYVVYELNTLEAVRVQGVVVDKDGHPDYLIKVQDNATGEITQIVFEEELFYKYDVGDYFDERISEGHIKEPVCASAMVVPAVCVAFLGIMFRRE